MRWLPLALAALVLMMSAPAWHPPVPSAHVTSRFGPRGAVTLPDGRVLPPGFHAGVDLRAAIGTPLSSVSAGRVLSVENGSSGKILRVEDDKGGRVSYVHLDRIDVRPGQEVRKGEALGATGASGGVAPHLHLEYRPAPWRETSAIDPAPLLGVS